MASHRHRLQSARQCLEPSGARSAAYLRRALAIPIDYVKRANQHIKLLRKPEFHLVARHHDQLPDGWQSIAAALHRVPGSAEFHLLVKFVFGGLASTKVSH